MVMDSNYFKQVLARLIAAPSISCASPELDQSNHAVIQVLSEVFDELGFRCEILPVDVARGKFNLVAMKGEGDGGLVLSGHSDTVPYDEGRWQMDPFVVSERDERFYGLGACDMKGFFAVIATAVRAMDLSGLAQPLVVLATADEESSMSGARALADAGKAYGRVAVIGEPTGLQPVRMHKGIMMERIRVTGQSGHSSNPALGINSIDVMYQVLSELMAFRRELQARWRNPAFEVDFPTMNFGHIHGGDNPNRICGHCELHFDLRPLPGMAMDELKSLVAARLLPVAEQTGARIELESLFPGSPSFETSATADIVRTCESLSQKEATAVPFATEAPFLQQLGMETVVMGPGFIDQAHQPNEFIAYDQVSRGVHIVRSLIGKYCLNTPRVS